MDKMMRFIEEEFNLNIIEIEEIKRGLLNRKWLIRTDKGNYFVKAYHPKRYHKEKLQPIKIVLKLQAILNQTGIKCPKVYPYYDHYIIDIDENKSIMISDYLEGSLLKPGCANQESLFSLGYELGRLHESIKDTKIDLPVSWMVPQKEELFKKWEENYQRVLSDEDTYLLDILKKQRIIFETMDFNIFSHLEVKLAHNDFWCDNLLFKDHKVSGILDFDRFSYSYQALDIARAVLSFILKDDKIKRDLLDCFIRGYQEVGPLTHDDVNLSLKLCYVRESLSWLGNNVVINNGPPDRFKEEMIYLTHHWNELV